jgi:hypothetical protein
MSTIMVPTKQNQPRSYIANQNKLQKAPNKKHHMKERVRKLISTFILVRIKSTTSNLSNHERDDHQHQIENRLAKQRRSRHPTPMSPAKRRKTTPSPLAFPPATVSRTGILPKRLSFCLDRSSTPTLSENGSTTGLCIIMAQALQWPMSLAISGYC